MYETIYIHFPGYLSFERKILFVLLLIDRVVYSAYTIGFCARNHTGNVGIKLSTCVDVTTEPPLGPLFL